MAKILTVILFDNDYFLNKENGKIYSETNRSSY